MTPPKRAAAPVRRSLGPVVLAVVVLVLLAGGPYAAARAQMTSQGETRKILHPAQDYKLCLPLARNVTVAYSFQANQAIDFTIHTRQDDQVQVQVKNTGLLGLSDSYRAPASGVYCLNWVNPQVVPAELIIRLAPPDPPPISPRPPPHRHGSRLNLRASNSVTVPELKPSRRQFGDSYRTLVSELCLVETHGAVRWGPGGAGRGGVLSPGRADATMAPRPGPRRLGPAMIGDPATMTDQLVDLYSDTHSTPSPAMRRAMAEAEVGDEQQGADPTTNRLQDEAAQLLGKEAALFLPSGTMCNQIAYRVWCQPGDEIILDKTGHAIHSETGGPAALSGAMVRPLDGERGIFTGRQVHEAVRRSSRHAPRSAVLSVENTCNAGGGSVWPLERVQEVTDAAREHGLKCHLDGARLLNAVVASGVSGADYVQPFDSCWIDLSKGLGCPVGAVLAGSRDFIQEAWRFKHQFGGAMRQSGIIAAAGLFALEHNVERLAEDHANARRLAAGIAEVPGLSLVFPEIETNMVYLDVSATGRSAEEVSEALLARGVHIGVNNRTSLRAVTHLDVSPEMVDRAAQIVAAVLAEMAAPERAAGP